MQHGLLALATQAPVSLLEAAAQHAFWDMNTATLLDMCKLLELAPEAQTLFAALLVLLQAFLPTATDVDRSRRFLKELQASLPPAESKPAAKPPATSTSETPAVTPEERALAALCQVLMGSNRFLYLD